MLHDHCPHYDKVPMLLDHSPNYDKAIMLHVIVYTMIRCLCYMIIPYHSADNDHVAKAPYHSVDNDHVHSIGALS